jgi:hypothetical protein
MFLLKQGAKLQYYFIFTNSAIPHFINKPLLNKYDPVPVLLQDLMSGHWWNK